MGWHPPVPAAILDADNFEWQVIRSWPDDSAEDYVLELGVPGRAGVRAAHLRAGQLELLRDGRDRRLPALKRASPLGVVVVHRAYKRAVVRAGEHHLKLFRARQSDEAVGRHERMNELLGAGDFLTPEIVSSTPGCLTLMTLPGRHPDGQHKAVAVADQVSLGAEATARTAQRMVFRLDDLRRRRAAQPGPRARFFPPPRRPRRGRG